MVVSGYFFLKNVVFEMEIDFAVCIASYSPKTSATLRLHPSHDWRILLKFHRFYPSGKMFCKGLHHCDSTFTALERHSHS